MTFAGTQSVHSFVNQIMAPTKFGLFKTRSRDHGDQPSTENLLQGSSTDIVDKPPSPIPSTSRGFTERSSIPDFSMLPLFDSDDEDFVPEKFMALRRGSTASGDSQGDYHMLKNQSSLVYSSSTLQEDLDQIEDYEDCDPDFEDPDPGDGASTSYDANSLQFDETSVAPSNDWSVYCTKLRKPKKSRSKDQLLSDMNMWKASNLEVMQNLLRRTGTVDEQIKWEAIATARGLCTLTDSCNCADCISAKFLAGVTDGDGGLGAAPLFSAISVGCQIQ